MAEDNKENTTEDLNDIAKMDDVTENKDEDEKTEEYEDVCYICHRPESIAGKMIRIPNNICICNDCMQKTFDSMGSFGLNMDDAHNLNNIDLSKMPNISMVNLADLAGFQIPQSQKIKKKAAKDG